MTRANPKGTSIKPPAGSAPDVFWVRRGSRRNGKGALRGDHAEAERDEAGEGDTGGSHTRWPTTCTPAIRVPH